MTMSSEAEVHQAFDYAKAAGMKVIVGVPRPDVLALVEQKVKQYNIKVAIHNHGPGDKTYPTPESAMERIKSLDKRIGLCIDIGHTARIGADPIQDVVRFADRLHDLHIKDVSAAAASVETLEIGRGVIDMPAFLKALIGSATRASPPSNTRKTRTIRCRAWPSRSALSAGCWQPSDRSATRSSHSPDKHWRAPCSGKVQGSIPNGQEGARSAGPERRTLNSKP